MPYTKTQVPTNIYSVADTILKAQSHSLFVSGFVNGDPHPGNIMLLDSGDVGLIDWGQVREYSAEQRCNMARLMIAVADRDQVLAAQYSRALGHKTERGLDWAHYKCSSVYFGRLAEADELGGIIQFEENLDKIDRRLADWGVYIMAARNVILTRMSVALLGFPELNTSVTYRNAAASCLERQGLPLPETVPGRLACPQPESLESYRRVKKLIGG